MKFWNKLCAIVLFLFLFCSHIHAQNNTFVKLKYNTFPVKNKLNISDSVFYPGVATFIGKGFQDGKPIISEDFSTACYSFFCRQELKIEKVTRIPFRFRLGSLQQCNYYEGKE